MREQQICILVIVYVRAVSHVVAFAFEEAEQLLAPLVGVEWERTTARFFRCYSRIAMGDFAAAARDAEATLVDAERRNDRYARGLFGTSPGVWSCLIGDDAEGATRRLASGRDGWELVSVTSEAVEATSPERSGAIPLPRVLGRLEEAAGKLTKLGAADPDTEVPTGATSRLLWVFRRPLSDD